ncbi:hypothetical protein A3753_14790 [Sulfitobacter sp. HI0082]|uniref:hypothetical protein n=1 Tax=uncultured Sulfitobacter sp. TaxID=191468 RepID=UPI0007CFA4C7|nr:hypothetical protein A3753_14790 [Sulfitobacter sp. HI0082]HAC48282.1 hypothetical protein [Sulfitobacter sp.]|tara:strand:+ start:201 stop:725 length:525 start_codon:yes stop_codon:yes gene_type:complete
MALTAKERKQKQLAREQEELRKLPDSTYDFLETPFYVAAEDNPNWSNVSLSFELMGLEPPEFEDDRGPADFAHEHCFATDEDRADAFEGYCGSIGRAEAMVDFLLDASIELASVINTYKKQALRDHRQQIENADLSDPDTRHKALETIARLTRIEDALDKNVRRTLPQWKVKGL